MWTGGSLLSEERGIVMTSLSLRRDHSFGLPRFHLQYEASVLLLLIIINSCQGTGRGLLSLLPEGGPSFRFARNSFLTQSHWHVVPDVASDCIVSSLAVHHMPCFDLNGTSQRMVVWEKLKYSTLARSRPPFAGFIESSTKSEVQMDTRPGVDSQ